MPIFIYLLWPDVLIAKGYLAYQPLRPFLPPPLAASSAEDCNKHTYNIYSPEKQKIDR